VTYVIGQVNNAMLYPGLCLGAIVSRARRISDNMFAAAANAVSSLVAVRLPGASLLPHVDDLRIVSLTVGRGGGRSRRRGRFGGREIRRHRAASGRRDVGAGISPRRSSLSENRMNGNPLSQDHMNETSKVRKIAFVGDHLPRKCGIATFTSDLLAAVQPRIRKASVSRVGERHQRWLRVPGSSSL
jgi:hypothetical protein